MSSLEPLLTPRQRRQSIAVLALIWFMTGVEYALVLPSAWLYLQHLGASDVLWLTLSIAMFSVATLIFSPIYGRVSDIYSTKTIIIVSNVFELLGNLLYLYANDVYSVVEARFICGMGAGAGAALFAYVARVCDKPEDISTNMGLIMTARAVGLVVGPSFNLIFGNLAFDFIGVRVTALNSPGLLMTIVWLLCQILCIVFFHDIPPEHKMPKALQDKPLTDPLESEPLINELGEDRPITHRPEKPHWKEFLNVGVLSLLFVQFVQLFNQTAWETFLTPFTKKAFSFEEERNSYMYMITAAVGIVVYIFLTIARRRVGQDRLQDRLLILVGTFIQMAGLIVYWVLPAHNLSELWKFALGGTLFVTGMPFAYAAPALQSKLTSRRTQGLGQGIRRSVVSLAQIVGPLWVDISLRSAFWGGICAFNALAALALILLYRQLLPRHVVRTMDNL